MLNRAVALEHVDGAERALAGLAPLATDKRMQTYQPYWAALGHLKGNAGDKQGAIEALTVAIGLTTDDAVRTYLHGRIAALRDG